jgi:tellurite resistance protein TerC
LSVSLTMWLVTIAAILVLIVMDFVLVSRKPHDVGFREAALWSTFYVAIAVAFGVFIWVWQGSTFGTQYFTAYIVEKSLSVDNLFVFVIILAQFAVPSIYHQRVLLVGVALALILRAIFIAIGAAALAAFSFTFVIFGAILIWTGIQLFRHRDDDPEPTDNLVVRTVRRWYPVSPDYDGTRLFTRVDGRRMATPLLLVMVAIASTDLLFALDSIPATFGVTREPYLVFTVNAAALLGLRALYFLLKGLLNKLIYLSLGLSLILIFIGVKLILAFAHKLNPDIPEVPTVVSLSFIILVLFVAALASWIKVRKDPSAVAHAGTVTKPKSRDESATEE